MRNEFYEGVLYQIEYKPELSDLYFTKHLVYHIKTEQDNYPKAHKAISSIMDDGSWTEGMYITKNKSNPSIDTYLHKYHRFSYDEELDVYVYTLVEPYDD